jgi:hypothetical protein
MDESTRSRIRALDVQAGRNLGRIVDLDRSLAALRTRAAKVDEALWLHARARNAFQDDRQRNAMSIIRFRSIQGVRLAQASAARLADATNGSRNAQAWEALNGAGASLQSELDRINREIREREAERGMLHAQNDSLYRQAASLRWEA